MSKLFLFLPFMLDENSKRYVLRPKPTKSTCPNYSYLSFILDENSKRYPLYLRPQLTKSLCHSYLFCSYWMKTAYSILSGSSPRQQCLNVQSIPIYLSYWMKTAYGNLSASGPSPQSQHVQAAHISLLENLFFLYQKQCFGAEACWLCTIPMCVKMLLSHFCSFLKYLSTTSYLNT